MTNSHSLLFELIQVAREDVMEPDSQQDSAINLSTQNSTSPQNVSSFSTSIFFLKEKKRTRHIKIA